MPTFSADQIIGKALIGKEPVKLVRIPEDGSPAVYTVPTGSPIGVVISYVSPGSGRTNLYWQFQDNTGRPYFAEHRPGRYNIEALSNQGALTLEQQQKAEEEKNLSTTDKIIRAGTNILLLVAGFSLLVSYLKKK
jgi:hypothetical protein